MLMLSVHLGLPSGKGYGNYPKVLEGFDKIPLATPYLAAPHSPQVSNVTLSITFIKELSYITKFNPLVFLQYSPPSMLIELVFPAVHPQLVTV